MALCLVTNCFHEAYHRYACEYCTERMQRHLREVETYAVIIRATKTPGRGQPAVRRAPGFGSSIPGRADALVADDYRSRSTGDGPDDVERDVRSLLGTLHGITSWLRQERDEPPPRGTLDLSREIGWLLPRVEWCATQQWVDELAGDISELHHQARRLAGDSPPKAVGPCLTASCTGRVYPALILDHRTALRQRVEGGRCSRCPRIYDWLDLINVRRSTL
ncbi:hypothetical protein JNUCC0626_19875 [Lentzea sp. JNUCC 0626]|uniref:hypothetical protein n=1 Tax=Lentzea sp. JNUCC 0626 TaxID=3367513 RepID=UPI0037486E72